MKILFINTYMHQKNLNALYRYNISITLHNNTNLENINLNEYDAVYSPSSPINVKKYPNIKFMFGPHFSVFPEKHHMEMIEGNNSIYLQPSEWAKNVWLIHPFCKNIIFDSLPFGVETDKFYPCKKITERNKVFIYYKSRQPDELQIVCNFLHNKGINPKIFNYITGYSENEYKEYLQESKFGIWLGRHESQGFALQEALSCDVPLLVWNVVSMNQEYGSNYENIPASTIPYWNNNCGEYFMNAEELPIKYDILIKNIEHYQPRQFIVDNLSIEKCSEKFINLVKNM